MYVQDRKYGGEVTSMLMVFAAVVWFVLSAGAQNETTTNYPPSYGYCPAQEEPACRIAMYGEGAYSYGFQPKPFSIHK